MDYRQAYENSFGNLPHETPYYMPQMMVTGEGKNAKVSGWNVTDLRPQLEAKFKEGLARVQAKALGSLSDTAGGAGTAGVAMIPVYVDPRIVDTTRKYTPLVEMIPRVTNLGITADFNTITAKGSAKFLAEDAALTEQDDTYNRSSTSIKYAYAVGRVTGQARAAYPSYILEGFQPTGTGLTGTGFTPQSAPNAKQLSVIMKSRTMREEEERVIVNGSTTSDSNEFDGIVTLQSTTNKTDLNTSALAYSHIESTIQAAFDDSGRPNLAIAASSVVGDIRSLMIDTFRYRPADMTVQLPFGVSSHLVLETMVGPVPVIPTQQLSNTSGSKSIYFLDMNFMEMRVLQDMTYEDLAKTNDSEKFMLKIYEALIMKNTAFNSWIGEIQ